MIDKNMVRGLIGGAVATIVMSGVMAAGFTTGFSPIPKPIPVALTASILGGIIPAMTIKPVGLLLHLTYGAFFGGVLTLFLEEAGIVEAVSLGIGLWLFMNIAVLPFLGWGLFGTGVTPKIAVATLILHLTYGLTLGLWLNRKPVSSINTFEYEV